MADSILGMVIEHLANEEEALRNVSLNWLCEGYMDDPSIAPAVFQQWSQRTPEAAYSQFPQLSYFPAPASMVDEACQRATEMAKQGGELTSLTTRCAGKLLEQTVQLPARDLVAHREAITRAARSHKIFFRVNVDNLLSRIALLDHSADQLAEILNQSVADLAKNPVDGEAIVRGQHALEALRLQHPNFIDLSSTLSLGPDGLPENAASFQLTLLSLAQLTGRESLESELAPHLQDRRESMLSLVLESLLRMGSGAAAQVLLEQFSAASQTNRRWIARGLQRMRVANLAPLIGQLRDQVSDHALWNMLLVAEMQQLDPNSGQRLIESLNDLDSATQVLIDAGLLYTFVCGPLQQQIQPIEIEACYRDFLARVQSGLASAGVRNGRDIRTLRKQQSKQIDQLFQKRRKQ